ncbi:MAG: metalloregulator ArsR/SmtB family transcription factor [Elusimicrobia bacterium]|nr:metalloregulator ArsR/SmtB family transcription factor [Elusimicrobiota bacterium]
MSDQALNEFMAVSKALADATRVRILALLADRPLCVCQITEIVALSPSTISKHLSILRQARLIETEKEGRWIHCRLTEAERGHPAAVARSWVASAVAGSSRLKEDRQRLRAILRIEPEEICRRQLKRRRTP